MFLAAGPFPTWGFFVVIIAIFYLLILRPQKKKEHERRQMLENLKKGARIVTIGGIYGTITSVKDNDIVVRVDDQTKASLRMVRSAVNRVLSDADRASERTENGDQRLEQG